MRWLVVGLGNPGDRYVETRHNIGFAVVDALRADLGLPGFRARFDGEIAEGEADGVRLLLLKPWTFMNLSGTSVREAVTFLKLAVEGVLVVHDEIDLPLGAVRVKVGGGHAGHNGLRSVAEELGSTDFARVRVGVGRPVAGTVGSVADHVLGRFDPVEREALPLVVARAVLASREVLARGPEAAMNRVNALAGVLEAAPAKPDPPKG